MSGGIPVREGLQQPERPKSWHCQEGGGLTHARIFLVNLTFNIHSVQNNCCNLGTAQRGGGSDPCQDFSGEFEQSFERWRHQYPQYIPSQYSKYGKRPGFWNTRPLSIVASRIYALFVAKSTSVPGFGGGGGGLSQSWQCQDFGSSGYGNPSLMVAYENFC